MDELERLRAEVANLRRALESRDTTSTAKGLLMATGMCTADEAFDLLVEQSQHDNVKLVEIARTLIAQHERRCQRVR